MSGLTVCLQDACDKAIQSFFKGWKPVQWTVSEIYVISRPDDSTPFTIKHTIKLGGAAAAKEEPEKEEKAEKAELPTSFYQTAGNDLRINCTWEEDAYETALQQVTIDCYMRIGGILWPVHSSFVQLASKILLVIDTSGSMSTELESVKAAVRYMIDNGAHKLTQRTPNACHRYYEA